MEHFHLIICKFRHTLLYLYIGMIGAGCVVCDSNLFPLLFNCTFFIINILYQYYHRNEHSLT
jgi:hypothetical protein